MEIFSPFWSDLHTKKSDRTLKIAFSDSSDPRVQAAAHQLAEKKIIQPIMVSEKNSITEGNRQRFTELLMERQSRSKIKSNEVAAQLQDSLYIGIALLLEGEIDGLVAGSLRPTADIVKAALQCIGPKPGQRLVSGQFLMESSELASFDKTPFLFADCAVMPEPSPQALAHVARSAAASYRFFTGKIPRVAMLSFSTRDSAQHPLVDRIKAAVEMIRKQEPTLLVDGEIQVDAALDPLVASVKNASDSPLQGHANVFVFPTLEAGNISYKLVQRFSKVRIAGPILWGLNKPMSDLSRGCTVEEIMDTALCVSRLAGGNN